MQVDIEKKEPKLEQTDIESQNSGNKLSNIGTTIINKIKGKTSDVQTSIENYKIGFLLMFTGLIFMALSTVFIPLVLLSPYKFIALNCFGTICIFLSIIVMKKKKAFSFLIEKHTVPYTMLFLTSLMLEFYFSMINKNYILVFITFGVNFISIAMIIVSFFKKSSFLVGSSLQGGLSVIKGMIGK